MKVLILGDINSVHIRKWCLGLAGRGISIGIFSLTELGVNWFKDLDNIEVLGHGAIKDAATFHKKVISKVQYLKVVPSLKKAIKAFKPDILHAHYATSYGLLGALSGFHPFYISMWGNDVFDFPNEGVLNREVLKYNLRSADRIFSTSYTMEVETKKYTDKDVQVIPFGVNLEMFYPDNSSNTEENKSIVIGTIKTLEKEYAIHDLIKAFSILKIENPNLDLKLLIAGTGTLEDNLKELVQGLGLSDQTTFTGFIEPVDVPKYHNMIDVFVCLSVRESFGVAVVEAMACGKPVVVSNADGLPEVVDHEKTGFVVTTNDPKAAAKAINELVHDKSLQLSMGERGRKKAIAEYDWNNCVITMEEAYLQANDANHTSP
ncbi:MAG: glycosyltransferase [Flavobacteriales bacterium]|nr:glycosyltransferase [Flavobacteriales bacterium]